MVGAEGVSRWLAGNEVTGKIHLEGTVTRSTVDHSPEVIPVVAGPAREGARGRVLAATTLRLARRCWLVTTTLHSGGVGAPGKQQTGRSGQVRGLEVGNKPGCCALWRGW